VGIPTTGIEKLVLIVPFVPVVATTCMGRLDPAGAFIAVWIVYTWSPATLSPFWPSSVMVPTNVDDPPARLNSWTCVVAIAPSMKEVTVT
jgi:hypothetical protein